MLNFLAEISIKDTEVQILPTPYNEYKQNNIYYLDISDVPLSSYWLDWGGYYDNYVGNKIMLYYSKYLAEVETFDELKVQSFTMYFDTFNKEPLDCDHAANNTTEIIDCGFTTLDCYNANNKNIIYDLNNINTIENSDLGGAQSMLPIIESEYAGGNAFDSFDKNRFVLLNVPIHTWLYPDYSVIVRRPKYFVTSPINDNQSDFMLNFNNNKKEQIYPLLVPPSFSVKLSDNINGIALNQEFNIELINNDGEFDNEERYNLFNAPLILKKSTIENPSYKDFEIVREGFINDTNLNFNSLHLSAADKIRAMTQSVCETIKSNILGDTIAIDSKALNKNIPVIYGTARVPLIQLANNKYIGAEFISQLIDVIDDEGNSVIAYFDNNMIITTNGEAKEAIIKGYPGKIGQIIKDLIMNRANIPYSQTYWNETETNNYINNSPEINLLIDSGDVRGAIQNALSNDMAYLIQQQNGKFTIRKYGNTYRTHNIENWLITQKPEKIYSNAVNNFFSSCAINYQDKNSLEQLTYIYKDLENEAELKYGKILRKTFDTSLININDVKSLAKNLTNRYLNMKQDIRLAIGEGTSKFELLDTVNLNLNINDREFSKAAKFMIKEINPIQDTLVLEEI